MDDELARLRREKAALEGQLAEARQAIEALTSGQVDAIVSAESSRPILLRAAQQKLLESQRLFRAVFEGALDAILLAGDDGRYVDVNPAACAIFGMAREELVGKRIADFAPVSYDTTAAWQAFLCEGRMSGTFPLRRSDASQRLLDFRARANILPGLHLSLLRDVTEEVATRCALRETDERLRRIVRHAPLILFATDADGNYTLFEGRGVEAMGRRPGELVGQSVFVIREDTPAVGAALRRALAGEEIRVELDVEGATFDTLFLPARDDGGRVTGVSGVAMDVTARRRAEDTSRASEERYRRIVENISEGITTADAEARFTFVNGRLAEILGYTREELIGRPATDFMDADAVAIMRHQIQLRRRGETSEYENRWRRKDGTAIWTRISGTPLWSSDGELEGTLAIVTDITGERQVREIRNRLASIVEQSRDAILSTDLDGTITSWNGAAERLYQYTAAEMIGRSNALLFPEGHDGAAHILRRIAAGETIDQQEGVRRRKDGTLVEVAIQASPIRDSDGRIVGVSKIHRDLTDQRKAEGSLRRTEEQLHQAQRLEAVAALAGGIAHDFNNLLSVILSCAAMILDELKPSDPIRADIEDIHTAGKRASELTRQLLAFGRQQILEPRTLDLGEILLGIRRVLERALREDIELTILAADKLRKVHVDPGQIEQVVMNLVVNARDAMPEGGRLTIELTNLTFDAAYAAGHPGVAPGDYVMLAVTDTGVGMDAATRARIFEPFFTTKEKWRGSGLGLSTVFGIVKQSGGHICVDSEPGVGTTFRVYFPVNEQISDEPRVMASQASDLRGTETVLVVEDEDQVRRSFRTILRKLGYNVLEAANGGEALLVCEDYGTKIHLLVTDVVMPRMSGRQLAERLSKTRPEMKVLFVSGYTEHSIVNRGVLDPGIRFLQKPITPQSLARKVREVLDSA